MEEQKILLDDLGQPAKFGAVCTNPECGVEFGIRIQIRPLKLALRGQLIVEENYFVCPGCGKESHIIYMSQEAKEEKALIDYWGKRASETRKIKKRIKFMAKMKQHQDAATALLAAINPKGAQ